MMKSFCPTIKPIKKTINPNFNFKPSFAARWERAKPNGNIWDTSEKWLKGCITETDLQTTIRPSECPDRSMSDSTSIARDDYCKELPYLLNKKFLNQSYRSAGSSTKEDRCTTSQTFSHPVQYTRGSIYSMKTCPYKFSSFLSPKLHWWRPCDLRSWVINLVSYQSRFLFRYECSVWWEMHKKLQTHVSRDILVDCSHG